MNIKSLHFSAFLDFANLFIRYRSKQSTSELSLIATEMVSTTVFFPIKKLFLQNENIDNFRSCLLKNYILHTFKFDTGFSSCCRLTRLVNMDLCLYVIAKERNFKAQMVKVLKSGSTFNCLIQNSDWINFLQIVILYFQVSHIR